MYDINDKLLEMKQNLKEKGKQPIFFIGSGLSKRYLNSPSWKELLEEITKKASCDYKEIEKLCNGEYEKIAQELEYYCFRNVKDEEMGENKKSHREILRDYIAKIFNNYKEEYKEKTTLEKRKKFNSEIKNLLMKIEELDNLNETSKIQDYDDISKKIKKYSDDLKNLKEIEELRKINPKAIITTNYDTLLEDIIFENRCHRRIGQEGFSDNSSISKNHSNSENEIDLYKIHGCVTKPDSIIITKEDYDNFFQKSRYLYSKIFTLFWEYPVIFIGYSVSDRNIKDILTVMIEIMTEEQRENFLRHIWIVDFEEHEENECVTDKEIELLNGKKIKVTCFCLTYYHKLYKAINEVVLNQHFGDLNFTISENVIELLIEPLYQQQDKLKVVVRELLQNALDACKKENVNAKINIALFKDNEDIFLEIKDNGIGMDLQEIKDNFLTVGKTSKKGSCEGLVGKYGIGILSIFLIGDYAEVYTKTKGNTLLALKIYIQSDKKQVDWLDNIPDEILNNREKSFTIVRIHLKDGFEIKDNENYMKMLGLESYVTKSENSIIVNFMNEQHKIPKIINKPGWFLNLSEQIKLYQFEYSNKEDKLEVDEVEFKKIMDKKGLIFYNDMISHVEYEKSEYNQLKNIGIPFVILDVKKADEAEKDIKTNLSRSALQVSGNVMKSIARGIYQLEIEKIMYVIQNSEEMLKKNEIDFYTLLKNMRNCSDILKTDVDIMMDGKKLFFSTIHEWHHIRVYGKEEISKDFNEDFHEPILYHDEIMEKSRVSDFIEDSSLVCISEKYLKIYIFNATSQHNGLRKNALIKILNLLEGININETWWIKQIWDYIKENKQQLIKRFHEKMPNGILWLNKTYNRNNIEAKGEYFIAFESQQIDQCIDDDFCEILQKSLEEKSLEHIIGIYRG